MVFNKLMTHQQKGKGHTEQAIREVAPVRCRQHWRRGAQLCVFETPRARYVWDIIKEGNMQPADELWDMVLSNLSAMICESVRTGQFSSICSAF